MRFDKLKEPFLLTLVGPPLSGKSTWIRKNFIDKGIDITIISRDQILMDVAESDDYNWAYKNVNQREVDTELQRQLTEASENGYNTIIDMTNMTSKRSQHNLYNFGDEFTKIAVIFPILDWEEYKIRNDKRNKEENKFIPENVIKNMIKSYQPIKDIEGFDKVVSL